MFYISVLLIGENEMTLKTYYIHTDIVECDNGDYAEHYYEHDDAALELVIAISADMTSDDPRYCEDFPSWDGETKSYYIEDYATFKRLADIGKADIQIIYA